MKRKGEQLKENIVDVKDQVDNHKDARALEMAQIIRGIGNVEYLATDEFVTISHRLFKLVRFCDCIRVKSVERKSGYFDQIDHKCNQFHHHDYQHMPYCSCCQTQAFAYYLAWCLDSLAQEGNLPEYDKAHLSIGRIKYRTYGYTKRNSKTATIINYNDIASYATKQQY